MGCTQGPACSSSCQVFAFLGFLASAMWINAAATELVNILRTLGIIFQLSNTVLGLTLLAWGNSIGGEGSAAPPWPPGTPWGPPAILKVPFCPSQTPSPTSPWRARAIPAWPSPPASAASSSVSCGCQGQRGGTWGSSCLSVPAYSPGRAPSAAGSLERSWAGSISESLHRWQTPQCSHSARDREVFGRGRDRASSTPLSPQLPQPQLGGSSGWSVAGLGFAKGKEGRALCLPLMGFGWCPDQAEASPRELRAVSTPENALGRRCRKEEDMGQRDVLSARSPGLCVHPERAPDILVGVGLGCLLQMTSSQPLVKVRPW